MTTKMLERSSKLELENLKEEDALHKLGFTLFNEINLYLNSELGENFAEEMAIVREQLPNANSDSRVNLPN